MKMRKLVAGLAAAATLLGGLALGAATATAADAAVFADAKITVKTTDVQQFYADTTGTNLRTFKYVKIASYENDNGGVKLIGALDETKNAEVINTAFADAGYDQTKDSLNDKWHWLGSDQFAQDKWAGFARTLSSLATYDAHSLLDADNKTLTFDFTQSVNGSPSGPGLYLIVDQTGDVTVKDDENETVVWHKIAPIMVGTAITLSNPSVNATGIVDQAQAPGAGQVEMKSTSETTKKSGASWQKTKADGTSALSGAVFNVYDGNLTSIDNITATPISFVKVENEDGAYRLPTGSETADQTDLTTTGTNGTFNLKGLALNHTYTVVEKSAPAGYSNSYLAWFTIEVDANGAVTYSGKDAWGLADKNSPAEGATYVVKNVQNITQLPLTGAAGTILFSVVAALFAAAGVTVFFKSRSTKRALRA